MKTLFFSKLVPGAISSKGHKLVTKTFWTKQFYILEGHHKVSKIHENEQNLKWSQSTLA